MGRGLALVFARAGSEVVVRARQAESLGRARTAMDAALDVLERNGALAPSEREPLLGRIRMTTDLASVDPQSQLVIETIPEVLKDKQDLLRAVEGLVGPATVITTNTSSLPLRQLAGVLWEPSRFAGYHWFNPPELVALVEVVAAESTSSETIDSLSSWSSAVGKTPVRVAKEVEGFVANRLQYALLREAYDLVERGVCSMSDVDLAVRSGLGPRWAAVGPFEAMDLAGLDVHLEVAARLFPLLSTSQTPAATLTELVRKGRLGAKSGTGLRGAYDPGHVDEISERRARVVLALQALSSPPGTAPGRHGAPSLAAEPSPEAPGD